MSKFIINFQVFLLKIKNIIGKELFQNTEYFQSSIISPKVVNFFFVLKLLFSIYMLLIYGENCKFFTTLLLEL